MSRGKCRNFKACPIVKRFKEKQQGAGFSVQEKISVCGDDLQFYGEEFLFDDEMAVYCHKLRKIKRKLENVRITWEAPVFGPSGYAFAARGYILGLESLGVRINVQPIWGDCKIIFESEVEKGVEGI